MRVMTIRSVNTISGQCRILTMFCSRSANSFRDAKSAVACAQIATPVYSSAGAIMTNAHMHVLHAPSSPSSHAKEKMRARASNLTKLQMARHTQAVHRLRFLFASITPAQARRFRHIMSITLPTAAISSWLFHFPAPQRGGASERPLHCLLLPLYPMQTCAPSRSERVRPPAPLKCGSDAPPRHDLVQRLHRAHTWWPSCTGRMHPPALLQGGTFAQPLRSPAQRLDHPARRCRG